MKTEKIQKGAIEIGKTYIKTKGRKAGKKVVVTAIENGFAIIEGKGMKKKRCNIKHLLPIINEKEAKKDKV